MTNHASNARLSTIHQLTILGIYGPDGQPFNNDLTDDIIALVTSIATRTPLTEQVNLLALSPNELQNETFAGQLAKALLKHSRGKLEAADFQLGNNKDSTGKISKISSPTIKLRQAYSVFALSSSKAAELAFVDSQDGAEINDRSPLKLLRLCGTRQGSGCLLNRFAAVHILETNNGVGDDHSESPVTDAWMKRIRDKSQWEEENLSISLPQSKPQISLRVWRHISANKAAGASNFSLSVSVAALDSNGGFANGRKFPWPSLTKDVEYFTHNTRNPDCKSAGSTADSNLPVVNIVGRVTFELTPESIALDPRRIQLVIGSHLATVANSIGVNAFVTLPSLEAAVEYARWLADNRLACGTAWVMGGQEIYRATVSMAFCRRVYLTRVFADAITDRFFPMDLLEKLFRLESVSEEIRERGIRYRFEVHRRCDL